MLSKIFQYSSKTIITLIFLVLQLESQNLICNGDFQRYSLPGSIFNQSYAYLPSNYSCWYNKNGGSVQIKRKKYPPVTSTAQLVLLSPPAYSLCQKVSLKINYTYQLNFSLVNSWTMVYSTAIVTLNNKWLANLTAYNEFTVIKGGTKFIATQIKNVLCFDTVFEITNKLKYIFTGPCLDNITLLQVGSPFTNTTPSIVPAPAPIQIQNSTNYSQPQQLILNISEIINETTYTFIDSSSTTQIFVQMFCKTQFYDSDFSKIVFLCKYQNIGIDEYLKTVSQGIKVFFENQEQTNMLFTQIQSTSMQLQVRPSRSYVLQKWSLVVPTSSLPDRKFVIVKFRVYVDGSQINFHVLSEEQVKIVKQLSSITQLLFNALQIIYSVLKATFFSYFLLDMISFWNLSLMYNFLNISTVPLFSKYFLEMMSKLFYKLTSILQWIIQRNKHLQSLLDFSNIEIKQLVESFKNEFAWFGRFGFSSNLLKNNIQQFFILFLLILKIGLLAILGKVRILPVFIIKKIPKGKKLALLYFQQLSGIIIYAVLSAGSTLLNLYFMSFLEKINSTFQCLVYFCCILLLPFLFLYKYETLRQKQLKKAEKRKTLKALRDVKMEMSMRMKSVVRSFLFLLQYIPYVVIPSTIIFNHPLSFLIVNFVIILTRLYYSIKFRKYLKPGFWVKAYLFLNILVWITHHGTYCLMFVIEQLFMYDESINNEIVLGMLKYSGFVTIFTILIGGLLELLRFIFNFLVQLYKIMKIATRRCLKSKIVPEQKLKGSQAQSKNEEKQKERAQIKVKVILKSDEMHSMPPSDKTGPIQNSLSNGQGSQKIFKQQKSKRVEKTKSIKKEKERKYYQFIANDINRNKN